LQVKPVNIFWETFELIESKLYMNYHWIVWYKVCDIKKYVDRKKIKMAVNAVLLNTWPYGKMILIPSSQKQLSWCLPKCTWRYSLKSLSFFNRWLPLQDWVHCTRSVNMSLLRNCWSDWTQTMQEWSLLDGPWQKCFHVHRNIKMATITGHILM
jgi:hypothetical protein